MLRSKRCPHAPDAGRQPPEQPTALSRLYEPPLFTLDRGLLACNKNPQVESPLKNTFFFVYHPSDAPL
jgi:hypothetical protein